MILSAKNPNRNWLKIYQRNTRLTHMKTFQMQASSVLQIHPFKLPSDEKNGANGVLVAVCG